MRLKTILKPCVLGIVVVSSALAFNLSAEVIFEENFDDQPDWTSAMHSSSTVQRAATDIIPTGWYSIRQDPKWAPSTGHPDRHETIEILASNADKARGGTGKSFVSYRDSFDQNYWPSESMLLKYFPVGFDQIYVEFWIRFDPNWTRSLAGGLTGSVSKMFRISSWSETGSEYQAFPGGDLGPMAIWDYSMNTYGMRAGLALRGGPHGDNYKFTQHDIPDIGHFITPGSLGGFNISLKSHLDGMGANGENPNLPDRVNGGLLKDSSGVVEHDQLFGSGDSWTKLGFFVKMNSAPDRKDGEFRMWLSDKQIIVSKKIPWIRSSNTQNQNAKWNIVAIGGNDYFRTYPDTDRHEEWYSIDDLVIRNDIPSYLESQFHNGSGNMLSPNPPGDIGVK
ncbi:hypothetical protein FE845_00520 [Marinobacter sp. 1-4A]|uniref:hypothetical protein n=1 Tax=Marinobacter sp. 1-4A TaxID=2582919 RepID=UPI0019033818|nr:hypothetical protein [Marinobacter sp. 1-4A]MBK1849811.1 hypothetical protein [Marinobacter sp. 1-4A]